MNDKIELAIIWRESDSFYQYGYYNIVKNNNIFYSKRTKTAFQTDMLFLI